MDHNEIQERMAAAQSLQELARKAGRRLLVDATGFVTLYHGTNSRSFDALWENGKIVRQSIFAASQKAAEGYAKSRHGKDIKIQRTYVDPRDIDFSFSTGEFRASSELVRTAAGTWCDPKRLGFSIEQDEQPVAAHAPSHSSHLSM